MASFARTFAAGLANSAAGHSRIRKPPKHVPKGKTAGKSPPGGFLPNDVTLAAYQVARRVVDAIAGTDDDKPKPAGELVSQAAQRYRPFGFRAQWLLSTTHSTPTLPSWATAAMDADERLRLTPSRQLLSGRASVVVDGYRYANLPGVIAQAEHAHTMLVAYPRTDEQVSMLTHFGFEVDRNSAHDPVGQGWLYVTALPGHDPVSLPPVGTKKPAAEIIDSAGPDALGDVRAVIEGTYAGLSVRVDHGSVDANDGIDVWVHIFDASGTKVGKAHRVVKRDGNGTLYAEHRLLELDPQVRGQSFATEFNRALEDWYRDSGVERIEIEADISVGGYAWARAGYDWRGGHVPDDIVRRLRHVVEGDTSAYSIRAIDRVDAEALGPATDYTAFTTHGVFTAYGVFGLDGRLLEAFEFYDDAEADIADRVAPTDSPVQRILARLEAGDYVSPYELSQVGRPPGAGRDDTWPGKEALLGSDWYGVKWLT